MNEYTRAVHFKNGESKLITDKEMEDIINFIGNGSKFVMVQRELVSVDTIARVGSHHDTAMQQKRNEADIQRNLEIGGQHALAENRRKLIKKTAISNVLGMEKETIKKLAEWDMDEKILKTNKRLSMSEKESENGEPDYYLNEFGEKMYS